MVLPLRLINERDFLKTVQVYKYIKKYRCLLSLFMGNSIFGTKTNLKDFYN
jgi:hypothetical protein